MAPRFVVTLVHGTWADTKGWVAAGSFLRRQLEDRLPTVVFREFPWSGTNTHAARTAAGVSLAGFIRDGHARHPDAQHFVIAHSHGGNVALYAMGDPAARAAVQGIVTLGTPFLHVRPRDPRLYADAIAWLMLGAAALIPFVLLDALHLPQFTLPWLIGAATVIVTMKPRLARWVRDTVTREQADALAELQPPAIDPSMLMILCARGDEARQWLRTRDVVAGCAVAIGLALVWAVVGAGRWNLPVVIDGLAEFSLQRGMDEMNVFGFDGWTLTAGIVLLSVVWTMVLLANALVEVGTDRVPHASDGHSHAAHVFDIQPHPVHSRDIRDYLRHSGICEDAAVVSAIRDWMAGPRFTNRVTPVD